MKSNSAHEQFVQLRAEGLSYVSISRKLKISKNTLLGWSKQHHEEISNLRALERESIMEQLRISKQHRLEVFSTMLAKIRAAIEERNLDMVSTEKLFDIAIRLDSILSRESEAINFAKTEQKMEDLTSLGLYHPVRETWTG